MRDHGGNQRARCPLCGGIITIEFQHKYSEIRAIELNGGSLSEYSDSVDFGVIRTLAKCASLGCEATWDEDEFELTDSGYFIDYKY